MKRLHHAFACLYPRWWRDRYGAEFEALIEDDDRPTLRSASDILTGALLMQLRTLAGGASHDLRPTPGVQPLLTVSSAVQAALATLYLLLYASSSAISLHAWHGTIVWLGYLTFTAGLITAAAGLLQAKHHNSWLPLAVNGLAFVALGFIPFLRLPIRLTTVAALFLPMAFATVLLALKTARGRTILPICGLSFVGLFTALSAGFIRVAPGAHTDLLWFGLYFAFSAICMLEAARKTRHLIREPQA